MAPKTVRNRIYARNHPGWTPHSVYSPMSDGRIQVSDYVGGHVTHILTLQDGKTWADFYNAWTQGTHAGHTNAMSLVARKEERPDWNSDPVDTAPGSGLGKTLGKRVSFADQDSNSSSEGNGSKPVKKKKPKKEKPSDQGGSDPNPPDDGGYGPRNDDELKEAAERYRRALENLKRKQEAVERAMKDAKSTFQEIQRKMARLQQEMGRADFQKKLKKLTHLLNDFSKTKARLEATKATIKNLKQAFRQKLHRIASSKNKNVQPDAPRGKDSRVADPVNLVTGAFVIEQTDAALPGRSFPLAVNRNYSNQIYCYGSFGRKWTSWFDARCRKMKSGAVYVWLGNGQGVWFLLDGNGGYEENAGSEWRLEKNGSRYSLINVDGAVQQFDSNGRIQKISDRIGNWARVSRNEYGHATSLRNSEGRELTITGSPIREVKDNTGRTWTYRYDNRGHLVQVTMPATKTLPKGRSTYFEYENSSDPRTWGNLKAIRNTRREVVLGNIYGTKPETFNRVVEQEDEDEHALFFQYSLLKKTEDWLAPAESSSEDASKIDFNEAVYRTVFTNALGIKTSYDFNEAGQPLESVLRAGSKDAESLGRSVYDSAGNLIVVHQPMGQSVRFKRDTKNQDPFRRGNALQIRQHPSGSGAARVTKIKYGKFNQPIEIQTPDGSVTRSTLNKAGLVERVQTPPVTLVPGTRVQPETTMKWNRYGQPTEIVDAAGRKTTISYYSSGNGAGLPKEQKLNGRTIARFRYDALGRMVESSDVSGVSTEFEYDELDQLLQVSEPSVLDTATRYEYDELGQLISESVRNLDEKGKARSPEWITTRYRHDRKGRVVSTEEPLTADESAVSKMKWDADDNLVEMIDPLGSRIQFQYDDRGQLTKTIANPGRKRGGKPVETRYEYDRNGNQTATVDPLGRRWTTEFDAHDRPVQTTDPAGNRVKLKWHSKADRVLSSRSTTKTGRLIAESKNEYDELGRITAERERVFAPNGKTLGWLDSRVLFDAGGQVVATIDPLGNRTDFQFDNFGQLLWTRDSIGNVERTVYDHRGLITSQISELVDGISPTKRQVFVRRFGYDDVGRPEWQEDGLGNRSNQVWDGLDRIVATSAADGSAERFEFDLAGRLIRQLHADGTNSRLRYDAGGRLLDMTNGRGHVTRLSYDDWHAPVSAHMPDGTQMFRHKYDAVGRITESTDARGVRIRTTFDELSQPTRQDISLRGRAEGITQQTFSWDRWGNLSAASNGTHKVQLKSDSLGRPHHETVDGRKVEWTYLKNHLLDAVVYPDGFRVEHRWDSHGRLAALHPVFKSGGIVIPGSGTAGPLATIDWLGEAIPQRHTYANGMKTTSQLDAAGRLLSVTTKNKSGKTVEQISTLRDSAGLVRSVLRDELHNSAFDYDAAGQLTVAREGAAVASPKLSDWAPSGSTTKPAPKKSQTELTKLITSLEPGSAARVTTTYDYDKSGNRSQLRRSKSGSTTTTKYNADSTDRYSQIDGSTQKYDAAGNLIDDGRFQFRYDGFSRLVRVTDSASRKDVLTQSYDPLGRVVRRITDGAEETMVWDGNDLLLSESRPANGTVSSRTFIPGLAIDQPLAEYDSQGAHYLHPDPTSSVIAVSDKDGRITERYHYSPFGQVAGSFDANFKPTLSFSSLRARFQGREQLGSLPYLDFRARAYSPAHGRFLQPDPIGLAGDPNQYRFALNNPLSYLDPMGTDPVGTNGSNAPFDQNSDLNNRRYVMRGAMGWWHAFFEGLMGVACPLLFLAGHLKQLNSQAIAANRSGKARSYLKELFDLSKLLPFIGGYLGMGELAFNMSQGKPLPDNLAPQMLGGIVGTIFMGTGGFHLGSMPRTPKVGGYGHAHKHAAFLNRLRAKIHQRRVRRFVKQNQSQFDAIQRARDLVNTNQVAPQRLSRLNTLPRRGTAGQPFSLNGLNFALRQRSDYTRLKTSTDSRKIPVQVDPAPVTPTSPVASFTPTNLPLPTIQGLIHISGQSLRATGETLAEFTRRVVGVMGHENWHSRHLLEFGRAANHLDELLARMTQFQIQNPQGYRHNGKPRFDAKPSGTWIGLEWFRIRHRDSAYSHLPAGVPNNSR